MASTLDNKCAKNLYKPTVLIHLIIRNVITCCFFCNTVYRYIYKPLYMHVKSYHIMYCATTLKKATSIISKHNM